MSTDTVKMLYTLILVTYGPTFGGNHDIYISNNANANTGSYTQTLAIPIDHQAGIPPAQPRRRIFSLALMISHLTRLKP
jgi:hypothetical protein